jgi:hypothetical protein
MLPLKDKKILFIAPKFFGYEKEIKNKMIEMGAEVDYFDERPANDFVTKSLIRLNRNLIKKKNDEYYTHIIENTKIKEYDSILIVRGEAISKAKLKELKRSHSNAELILYLWDSISYNPNTAKINKIFDKVFTFDYEDSRTYPNMIFRPLFFIDKYKDLNKKSDKYIYDIAFIGTVHTDRYHVIQKIKRYADEHKLNVFIYMYYPSKLLFWIKKLFDKGFRSANIKDFHFIGLSQKEIIEKFSESNVILDIERPKQIGLTMRTLEVFGSGKKLITTNKSIENYDIYNPENIYIIDRENPILDKNFLTSNYQVPNDNLYNKYSIQHWIRDLLVNGEK